MAWKDVGMNAGGADFMKFESGKSVKVHILGEAEGAPAEPKSFFQYYNQDVQRGIVVPAGYKDPSIKIRAQHAFLVYSYDDQAIKVWAVGNRVAQSLKGTMEAYDGSFESVDLVVKRSGQGLDTTYVITPKPTEFDAANIEGLELPDLEALFAEGTAEDIENLKNGIVPTSGEPEAAAETAGGEEAGGEEEGGGATTATRTAPPKAAPKAAPAADPRIKLVKDITAKFAKSPKYKTPAARTALIKQVSKGKVALTQLSVPELTKLNSLIK
jgi:hypothetical protein